MSPLTKRAIALLLVLACSQVVHGQSKSSPTGRDVSHTQNAKKPETASSPSNTAVVVKQETASTQGEGTKNGSKSYFARLFAPENLPNIALFVVGVGGIIVAVCTLKIIQRQTEHIARQARSMRYQTTILRESAAATRKAAEATEKSVSLQEIMQQQWIQIDGWRREGGGSREENPPRFKIVMDITNPTSVPLIIKVIRMSIRGRTLTRGVGNKLAPGNAIEMDFPITLDGDQMAPYAAHRLVLGVTGFVTYEDAFGKEQTQSFNQWCLCGPNNYFSSQPIELPDQQPEGHQDRN